jgi:hypothetical protein
LKLDTTPAPQTFTIKARKIDTLASENIFMSLYEPLLDSKAGPFSANSKSWSQDLFRIKFVMSEGSEETEGSVNESDAHSFKTKAE